MEGECENCESTTTLECAYCPDTGQELYLCCVCVISMTDEEKHQLASGK